MRTLYVVFVVSIAAGCASVAPLKVQSGDTCYRCHRPISDPTLAAELIDRIDRVSTTYPFRTSGCMARYLKANPPSTTTTIFVTDYRTGRMLDAGSAWFVPTQVTTPDGKKSEPDYVAFGSREDANRFRQDVPVRRWGQVLADAVPD
jgi:hypothetical protein